MASTFIRPIPSTPQNEQVTGALPSKSDAKSQASKGAAALQPDTVTLSAAAKSQQAQSTATAKTSTAAKSDAAAGDPDHDGH